jgi:hypothetical protein
LFSFPVVEIFESLLCDFIDGCFFIFFTFGSFFAFFVECYTIFCSDFISIEDLRIRDDWFTISGFFYVFSYSLSFCEMKDFTASLWSSFMLAILSTRFSKTSLVFLSKLLKFKFYLCRINLNKASEVSIISFLLPFDFESLLPSRSLDKILGLTFRIFYVLFFCPTILLSLRRHLRMIE